MTFQVVEEAQWVNSGLAESAGLYPLRVEAAVGRLVGRLLPGIITTTTGPRYYAIHPLAWGEAHRRGMDRDAAEDYVRRCEVVVAAICYLHEQSPGGHRRQTSIAHGTHRIPRFISGGTLDVVAAKTPGGYSNGGFAGTYTAPQRVVGVLGAGWPPRVGPRFDEPTVRAELGDLLSLADRDTIDADTLLAHSHFCPCCAPEGTDGHWLRTVLFAEADPEFETDLNRQVTSLMLMEAVDRRLSRDPDTAFRLLHGFGASIDDGGLEGRVRRAWRAAILRNYSVSAWRHLWRWVSQQLAGEAMTHEELADRLADTVGSGTVRQLIHSIPARNAGDELLPLEEELNASDEAAPRRALRQLTLGALRLNDLDGEIRQEFVGRDRDDLGPLWVEHQLVEHAESSLSDFARDLVGTMLVRARRVAASKMRLTSDLRPYVPTRLRDRDGLLSMVGEEADAEVSLRSWTLAQVLCGVGAIDRRDSDYTITDSGRALQQAMTASVRSAS